MIKGTVHGIVEMIANQDMITGIGVTLEIKEIIINKAMSAWTGGLKNKQAIITDPNMIDQAQNHRPHPRLHPIQVHLHDPIAA